MRRAISLLLSILMVISLCPVSAFANDGTGELTEAPSTEGVKQYTQEEDLPVSEDGSEEGEGDTDAVVSEDGSEEGEGDADAVVLEDGSEEGEGDTDAVVSEEGDADAVVSEDDSEEGEGDTDAVVSEDGSEEGEGEGDTDAVVSEDGSEEGEGDTDAEEPDAEDEELELDEGEAAYKDVYVGTFVQVTVSGKYKTKYGKPSLKHTGVNARNGFNVRDAMAVNNLGTHTTLKLTAVVTSLPELQEGETLAFYAINGHRMAANPAKSDLSVGDQVTLTLNWDSLTGVALVVVPAPEQEEPADAVDPAEEIAEAEETPAETVEETQDEVVEESQDEVVEESQDEVTEESQDEVVEESQDEVTEESQDEETEEAIEDTEESAFKSELDAGAVSILDPNSKLPATATLSIKAQSIESIQIKKDRMNLRGAKGTPSSETTEQAVLAAYDITINYTDENGEEQEWQPAKGEPVRVTIRSDRFVGVASVDVLHEGSIWRRGIRPVGDTVTFDAASFSVYAIIESKQDETDTYYFYDVQGAEIGHQTVVAGDYLYEPSTPVYGNQLFLGWYIDGATQPIAFNTNGVWTVPSVTGTTIRVQAKFADCYYATFRDQEGKVFSRIGVKSPELLNVTTLPAFTPEQSTQNMVGWSTDYVTDDEGYYSGVPSGKVTFPVTLTEDVEYWPIIEEGFWIHFDANRSHVTGMETVNVSYTAPIFVRQGQTATRPANPVADIAAYTFVNWYTDADCTTPFNWNTVIYRDITLYANWSVGNAQFRVIIWQQKVTDDKNATGNGRSWDYFDSYTGSAAIGSTVTYDNSLRYSGNTIYISNYGYSRINQLTYTGFERDSYDSSITVATDGSSVLNVYYRRKLMTIRFYVNQKNNGNWDFNTAAATHGGWGWNYSNNADVWREITGLYGATFAQSVSTGDNPNDYTWPSQYQWWGRDEGSYQTLLSAFTVNASTSRYYLTGESGSNTIYHVKQNADGSWPTYAQVTATNSAYADVAHASGDADFTVSRKYNTYHPVGYTQNNTYNAPGNTLPSDNIISDPKYPLFIYHARNDYTIEFYDGNSMVDSASKLYEASLAEYAAKTLEPADAARYTFGGWSFTPDDHLEANAIDWSTQTMPAQPLRVYAIWVNIAYKVMLDLGADDATMNNAQSMIFWPVYGATINGDYMLNATRPGHILVGWVDANGNSWNFANAITKDLCDEGPRYDEDYQNYY